MFEDFLTDRADLYSIIRSGGNRTNLDFAETDQAPSRRNIPCRILGDRILCPPDVLLAYGDVLEDLGDGERYEVMEMLHVYGRRTHHHQTYTVRRKVV